MTMLACVVMILEELYYMSYFLDWDTINQSEHPGPSEIS